MSEQRLDLDQLATEGHREELRALDLLSTQELVELMNQEDQLVARAVAAARDQIARVIDAVAKRLAAGGRLIYTGAGTPGRLAVLDASECGPTFNVSTEQIQAVLAGGERAFVRAVEDAEDDAAQGAADLAEREVGPGDCVFGISASGRTPYVLGGFQHAREAGALTVGLVSNEATPMAEVADLTIEVLTGPEIITGSTRLKAGTAQKLVLNMISTIVMVRLGRTFGNLMVEVRTSNDKLRSRARRIVRLATGCGEDEAERVLVSADGDAKVAILMLLTGDDARVAAEKLKSHDGYLRNALGNRR
jgi:N-acetylmuramic acid 6-phosphate etherase